MLLAVLEKRAGLRLGQYDVFVNVAGGVRVDEPAADLGMALAIVSSLRDIPAESQTVVVGEVGLGGEVRTVSQVERRAMEAAKLGFTRILIPRNSAPPNVLRKAVPGASCEVLEVETITQAIDIMLGS
jgi:DNA repair protein RadA/Sms